MKAPTQHRRGTKALCSRNSRSEFFRLYRAKNNRKNELRLWKNTNTSIDSFFLFTRACSSRSTDMVACTYTRFFCADHSCSYCCISFHACSSLPTDGRRPLIGGGHVVGEKLHLALAQRTTEAPPICTSDSGASKEDTLEHPRRWKGH